MIDKTFGYSAAGNIDQINNTATPMNFTYNSLGGGYLNQYTYDGLNRLTAATGNWTGSTGPETYSINMAYDKMGGITWKNQSASLSYPGYPGQKYNYYYTHGNTAHPHATSKIWDRRNHTQYTYGFDANGNPTTTHEQYAPPKQGKANPSGPITLLQENYWDERNQLRGLWNTSGLNHYIYDADGQRLMKSTLPMAHSSVDAQQLQATNSFPSAQYTVYVNAGLVYESDGGPATYTKHYYAGPLRVASHIGSGNPNQETHPTSGGNLAQGGPAGSTGSSNGLAVLGDLNGLLAHYGMSVPPTAPPTDTIAMQVLNDPGECDAYYGADVIEKNRCLCDHFPDVALQQGIDCSPYTPIYWYHPDYIGNVEFVSDRTGQPYQHFYYAPFGDPMVSQHVGTGSFNSDFRFNAKEYDEETGNYYYGARYYDPKVSLWMGVDPLAHKFPHQSPYMAMDGNPISKIDPDGRAAISTTGDNDDILIHGSDGNTVTVKAPGEDIHVNVDFEVGESQTIDLGLEKLEDFAIGYQGTVQGTGAAGIGSNHSLIAHNVMFFNSEYGGYWYTYAGGETAVRVEAGFDASLSVNGSMFLAVSKTGNYDPQSFAGGYYTGGISPALKLGVQANLNFQYSESNDWRVFEAGAGAGIGPSAGFGGIFGGGGRTSLLTPVKKTSERSWFDIGMNQLLFNPLSPLH